MDRRDFLTGGMGASVLAGLSAEAFAQGGNPPASRSWDAGQVRHLLPTVSDTRILIKASFHPPLSAPPSLHIGTTSVRGRMSDTRGEFWQFYATGLQPGRKHSLLRCGLPTAKPCASHGSSRRFPLPARVRKAFGSCFSPAPAGQTATEVTAMFSLRRTCRRPSVTG